MGQRRPRIQLCIQQTYPIRDQNNRVDISLGEPGEREDASDGVIARDAGLVEVVARKVKEVLKLRRRKVEGLRWARTVNSPPFANSETGRRTPRPLFPIFRRTRESATTPHTYTSDENARSRCSNSTAPTCAS